MNQSRTRSPAENGHTHASPVPRTSWSTAPGLRRGRRHPDRLLPGDPVDFWRVEAVEPDRLLRFRAEMRLPGRAWLQFEVSPAAGEPAGPEAASEAIREASEIRQTAIFDPRGLAGLTYWYALWPVHALVFRGMLRRIVRAAERSVRS